jgi:hypothetical protein
MENGFGSLPVFHPEFTPAVMAMFDLHHRHSVRGGGS